MLHRLPIFAALIITVSPLLAETVPPASTPSRDDPNRVICRREQVTGSLAQTKKICMTRAEWAARTRDTQQGVTDMQNRGLINSCGSSTPGAC